MKKLLLFITALMLAFTLAACNGNGEEPDPDAVELIFWHAWGEQNQQLVDDMFESFQDEYPDLNVSLVQIGQGGFNDLRDTMIHAIAAGSTPTMVVGYPDHFANYIAGNALRPLNPFIDSEEDGVGIDISDFIEGFMAENMQFGDYIYSMPLAKSTEMVVFNKTVFDHHEIYPLEMDRAVTWDDLEQWRDILVGDGDMQCEFLFNADSASNFYINSSRQFGAGYTNTDGEVLVDNQDTVAMLEYFQARFADNTLVLPIEWDQAYGSNNFLAGDVCMTQGSTAGTRYNIPTEEAGKFGQFEIGIIPVVQNEECSIDPLANPDTINPRCSAMQQGPNVAITADASEDEAKAAWLFIRHMTNEENTRYFAQNTGYIPVRNSAFESAEYQAFLETTDPEDIPFAMSARAAYNQVNFYRFDPAFIGEITSSAARDEVGLALEALFTGDGVNDVMAQLRNRLRITD